MAHADSASPIDTTDKHYRRQSLSDSLLVVKRSTGTVTHAIFTVASLQGMSRESRSPTQTDSLDDDLACESDALLQEMSHELHYRTH